MLKFDIREFQESFSSWESRNSHELNWTSDYIVVFAQVDFDTRKYVLHDILKQS